VKFGPVPLEQAEGKILGHNVTGEGGRRLLRKGKALDGQDLARLRELGRRVVYVAVPEAGDVDEDAAALRVSRAVIGDDGIRLAGPSTGRVNLYATAIGIVRVDVDALERLNEHEGITLATLATGSAVGVGKMVGTTKILPYALDERAVRDVEAAAAGRSPILRVEKLPERRVGLVLTGSRGSQERVATGFRGGLEPRIAALGSRLEAVDYVVLEEESGEEALRRAIERQLEAGLDLVILAGETAIMDRHDIAPRAVELAGGEVVCFGAPVDPGNLLMLGYVRDVPVVGAPGCARSPKRNIVDLVLPRLLAGERLVRRDVVALGHGGLLEDVPERPMPRSSI
jgi:molybdenum cofactor cytidylyltransferase